MLYFTDFPKNQSVLCVTVFRRLSSLAIEKLSQKIIFSKTSLGTMLTSYLAV